MARRKEAPKREVIPDPKFGSESLAKFMNVMFFSNNTATAEKIIYGALDLIAERSKTDPMEVYNTAIDNVRPLVEVKSRRVGGATYQVPIEVRPARQAALAMRWVADAARARGEKSMGARLAAELMEAAEKRGAAMKKRDDVHRMAEANKAFSHYRW